MYSYIMNTISKIFEISNLPFSLKDNFFLIAYLGHLT